MKKEVFWRNSGYRASPPLKGTAETTYLIVGGGIAGLSSAYFLIRNGVKPREIIIVEESIVGSGSTGHSAGMLIAEPENRKSVWWRGLIDRYGLKVAHEYRQAHLKAMRTVKKIIAEGNIQCDAVEEDLLFLARNDETRLSMEDDMAARKQLGERPRNLKGGYLMRELKSPWFTFAGRSVPGLSVNPLALAQGIASYLRKKGVHIYEHTPLVSSARGVAVVSRGKITYKKIIYTRGMGETRYSGLRRYVTSIAVSKPLPVSALRALHLLDGDMFVNEKAESYCYYGKITGDKRLLIGFGDIEVNTRRSATRLRMQHIRNIQRFLAKAFPDVPIPLEYAWSGGYSLTTGVTPRVSIKGDEVLVNGAGTQLSTMATTEYAVAKVLGKKHPLDILWGK